MKFRLIQWAPYNCLHCQSINKASFPQLSPVSITVGIFPAPLSFQKEFSFDEKDDPAKSSKDIDVSLLANLPKGEFVSFLSVLACKWPSSYELSQGFWQLLLCNSSLFARWIYLVFLQEQSSHIVQYELLQLLSWQILFNPKCRSNKWSVCLSSCLGW